MPETIPPGDLRRRSSIREVLRRPVLDPPPVPPIPGIHTRISTGPVAFDILRPRSVDFHRRLSSRGRLGSDERPTPPPRLPSPPAPPQTPSNRRLSFMQRFRYASDPQLSTRYREQSVTTSPTTPEGAPAPTIGITAPPWDDSSPSNKNKRGFMSFVKRQQSFKKKSYTASPQQQARVTEARHDRSTSSISSMPGSFEVLAPQLASGPWGGPYPDGAEPRLQSVVPASRLSESMTSRTSSEPFPSATTKNNISTSNFLKLPRRKKKPNTLFPLPIKIPPPGPIGGTPTPQNSLLLSPLKPSFPSPTTSSPPLTGDPERNLYKNIANEDLVPLQSSSRSAFILSSVNFAAPASPLRQGSTSSARSATSSPAMAPSLAGWRPRSGTVNSFHSRADDDHVPIQLNQDSGRNSGASTTLGRNSIAGLRSLTSKFRHPSDLQLPRHGSPGGLPGSSGLPSSKDSFALSRETLVVPERENGEPSGKYYTRLERDIPKKSIAFLMAKSADPFSHDVLRSLMRTFKFYEEPMDISLRRFLWEIKLPGEAQQIDRVMSAFAERYHECNPHIFSSFDQAFLAAYSLVILHSDLYNKSNKRKMQRHEYQKNTGGQGIDEEILGYFYDNIQYTEFIEQTPDNDDLTHKAKASRRANKSRSRSVAPDGAKNGKLDPYDFIIDDKLKLDILRPSLKEVMNLDDSYSFLGTTGYLDTFRARAAFVRPAILQIISARSRPAAFTLPLTITNPSEAHPGIVEIKVAMIGTVWRKDAKKKRGRSPWQEWGVLLTPSQLYFFKNAGWIKGLAHQFETHQKQGQQPARLVLKPQLEEFKPDASVRVDSAVALIDTNYKKHKNAFILVRHGKPSEDPHEDYFEEVLLADNESEMNSWLMKINYAAAYMTTNIGMLPLPHPSKEDQGGLDLRHPDYNASVEYAQITPQNPSIQTTSSVSAARSHTVSQRVSLTETAIVKAQEKLEDDLKSARHLQILVPFPPKTRGDLLAVGARMAYRVKKSRFELCRLKCQRDILEKDLEEETVLKGSSTLTRLGTNPSSPRTVPKSSSLDRVNSKVIAMITPHRVSRHEKTIAQTPAVSPKRLAAETDLEGGIDEAFATPPETLSRFASHAEGPYKLPPLTVGSRTPNIGSGDTRLLDAAHVKTPTPKASVSSLQSQHGWPISASQTSRLVTPTSSTRDHEPVSSTDRRPETADDSDREPVPAVGSPESRTRVRRSLQRTLRESPGSHATQYHNHRSKKGKESVSSAGMDDASPTQDSEGLARGGGSFTVHGKKASVITLGSEWQQISAEERLRLRKQAQSDSTAVEDETENGQTAKYLGSATRYRSSHNTPRRSVPLVLGDDGGVDYLHSRLDEEDGRRSASTRLDRETLLASAYSSGDVKQLGNAREVDRHATRRIDQFA